MTLQKQKTAKALAASKPWQCPCGVTLTISISLMLAVCILGRLNHDAIEWSPSLVRDDAAASRMERLEALKAEKSQLTLQHSLLELEKFQTEASDMMAKHPGIPEASKLEGFARDAKALHGALQELTGAEVPQVEDSNMQVSNIRKSRLASAKARRAGSGF